MKKLKLKIAGLVLLFAFFYACDDSLNPKVDRDTTIGELFIENGGIDGKTLIKGVYSPDGNTYTFNEVPAETDLQNIKFNGQISLGAAPEFERYDFFKTNPQVVKVINREKSETYNVQLNILAPAMDPTVGRIEVTLEDGVTVVVGEVDEENKTLWLDAKKGEHVFVKSITMLPKHAQYEFTKIQGTKITVADPGVIKMDHMGRKAEYAIDFITIPPAGVDFEKVKVYDFTKEGLRYPGHVGAIVRGQGSIDGNRVVIPVQGKNIVESLPLSSVLKKDITTGKTESANYGGYSINNAFAFNDYIYTTPLLIGTGYVARAWQSDVTATPTHQYTYPIASRYGDGSTMQLDENGNGYIFSIHSSYKKVFRGKVVNYVPTEAYDEVPTSIDPLPGQAAHIYLNAVRDHSVYGGVGSVNEYLVMQSANLTLFDRDMKQLFNMSNTNVFPEASLYACIFMYNKGRYLGVFSGAKGKNAFASIYDLTEGNTTVDALQYFKDAPKEPVYQFDLGLYDFDGSTAYGGTISTTTDKSGEKLYIMAIGGNTGMVVLELPKKVDE